MEAEALEDVLKGIEEQGGKASEDRLESQALTVVAVLQFFTGSPPDRIHLKDHRVLLQHQLCNSTCFLTAQFPINFRNDRNQYALHASGSQSGRIACAAYNAWVLDSPRYGML